MCSIYSFILFHPSSLSPFLTASFGVVLHLLGPPAAQSHQEVPEVVLAQVRPQLREERIEVAARAGGVRQGGHGGNELWRSTLTCFEWD